MVLTPKETLSLMQFLVTEGPEEERAAKELEAGLVERLECLEEEGDSSESVEIRKALHMFQQDCEDRVSLGFQS